jgi:hypothetical protein
MSKELHTLDQLVFIFVNQKGFGTQKPLKIYKLQYTKRQWVLCFFDHYFSA